jgi:predicted aspartyl protease
METATMGKVIVSAKIENLQDLYLVDSGHLQSAAVRAVEVDDALVDTGETGLCVPYRLIQQLGLRPAGQRFGRTAAGVRTVQIYSAVRLTVQGRDCICDVSDVPDDCPVLIGQVPLELLDFVVDPRGLRLMGNPDHGGQHMIDMF